jgi:chromosomal replication initiation ATPase DnaA
MHQQLVLPISWTFSKAASGYVVTDCNEYAVKWLEKWPFQRHDNFVCLVGEKGAGKTHLATLWATRQNAEIINATDDGFSQWYHISLENPSQKFFVLDDADELRDDVLLFYIFNTIKSQRAYLLMTAKACPCAWQLGLEDVKSRLTTANVIKIQRPTEAAMNYIIEKMLLQRGIRASPAIIEYIANRIERSYESINYWILQIDQYLISKKAKISINNVRRMWMPTAAGTQCPYRP